MDSSTPLRSLFRRCQVPLLAVALVAGGAGIGAYASTAAQGNATPVAQTADPCPDSLYGPGSEPWNRSELYFGTTKKDGTAYSEEEFHAFLDAEITPRFPDGLTLLTGVGQWRNSQGKIIQEPSELLIILYPPDPSGATSAKLEEIRKLYEEQFHQESVLRADAALVCTSF